MDIEIIVREFHKKKKQINKNEFFSTLLISILASIMKVYIYIFFMHSIS